MRINASPAGGRLGFGGGDRRVRRLAGAGRPRADLRRASRPDVPTGAHPRDQPAQRRWSSASAAARILACGQPNIPIAFQSVLAWYLGTNTGDPLLRPQARAPASPLGREVLSPLLRLAGVPRPISRPPRRWRAAEGLTLTHMSVAGGSRESAGRADPQRAADAPGALLLLIGLCRGGAGCRCSAWRPLPKPPRPLSGAAGDQRRAVRLCRLPARPTTSPARRPATPHVLLRQEPRRRTRHRRRGWPPTAPLIDRVTAGTGIDPNLLEGLVFVESAGRPQVIAGSIPPTPPG